MLNYNKYICQHKVKRFNAALGRFDYFPCGRCLPCLQKKAAVQSKKIETEINNNKYNYLITLTYDSTYIPYVNFKSYFSARDNSFNYPMDIPCTLSESDLFYFEYPSDWREDPYSLFPVTDSSVGTQSSQYPKYNKSLKIPVINYYDIKLFFKKIRRSYDKYAAKQVYERYERLKYFVLAEYGGKFKRPHYHIVLSTNSKCFSDWLQKQFVKATHAKDDKRFACSKWQFGFANFEPITKSTSVSSYVSSYVTSIYNCPNLYKLPHFKPRTRHSSNYGVESTSDDECFCHTALNMSPEKVVEFTILRNGKRSNFTEVYNLYNAVAPSYPFESIVSPYGYVKIFKCFARHSNKSRNCKRYFIKRELIDCISNNYPALYEQIITSTNCKEVGELPYYIDKHFDSIYYRFSSLYNNPLTKKICTTFDYQLSRNCKRYFIKRELIDCISNNYPALYEQIITSTNCKEVGELPYYIDKHFDSIYYRFSSLYNNPLTKKICTTFDYQLWRKELRKCVEMKRLNEFLRYQEVFGYYSSLYLSSNEHDEYSQIALTEAKNSFDRQKNRKLHNDKLIKF
nr:replication initiation protein [uncultured phage]